MAHICTGIRVAITGMNPVHCDMCVTRDYIKRNRLDTERQVINHLAGIEWKAVVTRDQTH